jgi:hypothetical protein
MIIEVKKGLAFASDSGKAMTQSAEVSSEERRYIMERMRSADKTLADDIAEWREAGAEEVEAWREAEAKRRAEEMAEFNEE